MNISVIIPTHNRARLLERALQSVLGQAKPAREIIVVDDGSDDGTAEIMRARLPQIHCIWQRTRGVANARNRGIEAASGDWLAFLDSDDEWLPRKLASQEEMLAANPQCKICHTDEIWIRNGKRVNAMKKHAKAGGFIFERCLPLCVVSPSSALIHRSVFDEVGLFNENLPAGEDYDLWLRICARFPVLYVDRPLIIKYGGHADQLSHRYPAMDRFRIIALENILQQNLPPQYYRAALNMLITKIDIYLQGAIKRDKQEEITKYQEKQRYYLSVREDSCHAASVEVI
ncbi:MAG: glycosyltransferase [Gammaproteobacteria bacterium]|nr:glycosyltransferase [Gammaproteobacteria bacterium]